MPSAKLQNNSKSFASKSQASKSFPRLGSSKPFMEDEEVVPEHEPVHVTEKEIKLAFQWLSKDGKRITKDDIKSKLTEIVPQLSLRDYKLFVGKENETMSLKEINSLLLNRDLYEFKPIEEAFHVIRLANFIKRLCVLMNDDGYIRKNDYKNLMEKFDTDKDGKISMKDFEQILKE
ncbi:hypothetical protein ROZALSC1DRAFT_26440 [Rozella allomycis CSF55]|uniref:EF-Hand 1, calcium-binding site domain-containing protein n=1 Tax=Rozella allomycis (strain CSF55) TaxID=988480 RepID=A0A075AR25_ROZAC|nr:EF-Hand 1, calcium-binding site domain-containing protein [Rozella allomycis CSF55]RKP22198.1 hypothetical protein ROZALSC1DRAFT_26440 [Rozella allomycis CSF55]|eukprot:EPZ31017.1 EF-Hand 1, calcium-binding site domain-containing protein [Rozella allomycis CSF55]